LDTDPPSDPAPDSPLTTGRTSMIHSHFQQHRTHTQPRTTGVGGGVGAAAAAGGGTAGPGSFPMLPGLANLPMPFAAMLQGAQFTPQQQMMMMMMMTQAAQAQMAQAAQRAAQAAAAAQSQGSVALQQQQQQQQQQRIQQPQPLPPMPGSILLDSTDAVLPDPRDIMGGVNEEPLMAEVESLVPDTSSLVAQVPVPSPHLTKSNAIIGGRAMLILILHAHPGHFLLFETITNLARAHFPQAFHHFHQAYRMLDRDGAGAATAASDIEAQNRRALQLFNRHVLRSILSLSSRAEFNMRLAPEGSRIDVVRGGLDGVGGGGASTVPSSLARIVVQSNVGTMSAPPIIRRMHDQIKAFAQMEMARINMQPQVQTQVQPQTPPQTQQAQLQTQAMTMPAFPSLPMAPTQQTAANASMVEPPQLPTLPSLPPMTQRHQPQPMQHALQQPTQPLHQSPPHDPQAQSDFPSSLDLPPPPQDAFASPEPHAHVHHHHDEHVEEALSHPPDHEHEQPPPLFSDTDDATMHHEEQHHHQHPDHPPPHPHPDEAHAHFDPTHHGEHTHDESALHMQDHHHHHVEEAIYPDAHFDSSFDAHMQQ